MSQMFYLQSGDTAPVISGTLYDGTGAIVDLTNATSLNFVMGLPGSTTPVVDAAGSFGAPRTAGGWSYQWVAADTATPGEYEAVVQVTWNSGNRQTFPSSGYIAVVIGTNKN